MNMDYTASASSVPRNYLSRLARALRAGDIDLDLDIPLDPYIEHGVAAIAWHAMQQAIPTEAVLPQRWRAFHAFEQQLRIIHQLQRAEFCRLAAALHESGVAFIILKGWALAYSLYPQPHLRPTSDIDILIAPGQSELARSVCLQQGFHDPRGWEPRSIIDQFSMKKSLVRGLNLCVDIHREISNDRKLQPILRWEELRAEAVWNEQLQARLISRPAAALHGALHLLHHRQFGDMLKLVWFFDLYLLHQQMSEAELDELAVLVDRTGTANLYRTALRMTGELFHCAALSRFLQSCADIAGDPALDHLLQRSSRLAITWRNLLEIRGAGARLRALREMFFPPAAEIYRKYGTDVQQPLPLLYARRIVTGLKHMFSSIR